MAAESLRRDVQLGAQVFVRPGDAGLRVMRVDVTILGRARFLLLRCSHPEVVPFFATVRFDKASDERLAHSDAARLSPISARSAPGLAAQRRSMLAETTRVAIRETMVQPGQRAVLTMESTPKCKSRWMWFLLNAVAGSEHSRAHGRQRQDRDCGSYRAGSAGSSTVMQRLANAFTESIAPPPRVSCDRFDHRRRDPSVAPGDGRSAMEHSYQGSLEGKPEGKARSSANVAARLSDACPCHESSGGTHHRQLVVSRRADGYERGRL